MEKVAALEVLGIDRGILPRRVYRGAAGNIRRYFPRRLPVALDAERAVFVYVDPGQETATALRSWGTAHSELWNALWDPELGCPGPPGVRRLAGRHEAQRRPGEAGAQTGGPRADGPHRHMADRSASRGRDSGGRPTTDDRTGVCMRREGSMHTWHPKRCAGAGFSYPARWLGVAPVAIRPPVPHGQHRCSCKWMVRRPFYRTIEDRATNPYTTTFSTSISSLSTPRTSPPVTSRIRNLGGVSTCPSHSPSGEMTVYGDPSSG